jgi:hypothetical protein
MTTLPNIYPIHYIQVWGREYYKGNLEMGCSGMSWNMYKNRDRSGFYGDKPLDSLTKGISWIYSTYWPLTYFPAHRVRINIITQN